MAYVDQSWLPPARSAPRLFSAACVVTQLLLGCRNEPVDTNCTTLICVQRACQNRSDEYCADELDCDPAQAAIADMQYWKEQGIPRNILEKGYLGEYGPPLSACDRAALNFIYGDDPPDYDFDPCLVDASTVAFPDFDGTIAEWSAGCENDAASGEGRPGDPVTALCSGREIELVFRLIHAPERRYYDAESGEFLGYEGDNEFPVWGCLSTYWPRKIPCVQPVVTEVICGDRYHVGDVLPYNPE